MTCPNGRQYGRGGKSISAGLQFPAATLLNLIGAMGQPSQESINLVANFGGRAKAGICGHVFANPVPDGLVRIESGV